MKEMKTKEFRDTPKGKDRGSPLSHHIKEEIRHTAVSQMQTGEEQDNASDYANDRAIKAADRVVSEAAHSVSVATEAGKHLFVEHLRKEPPTSSSMETPIPDEPPLWDTPPEAESFTPQTEPAHHTSASPQSAYDPAKEFIQDVIYHQESVYTQPANAPATDFKGRDSGIHIENTTIRIGNNDPSVNPQTLTESPANPAYSAAREYVQSEIYRHEAVNPQGSSILPADFERRDSGVRVDTAPLKTSGTISPNVQQASVEAAKSFAPQSAMQKNVPHTTLSPEFAAKLEAKQALIKQEVSASTQQAVISAGQSLPTESMSIETRMFNASKDRIPVNTEHQIHTVEAGRAFAQKSAVSQIAEQNAASAPVTAPKSKDAKEPTLKLRLEEESNKLQIKVKGYEAPKKAAVPQEQELKAAAKQFVKEIEIKGQTIKKLSADPLPTPRSDSVPTEKLSGQKSGIKKLFPQKASAKEKNISEKKPQAKAFSKAGKNLKLSDKTVKTADRVLSAPSTASKMRQTFIGSVEKAKQAEQVKKAAGAVAAFAKKAAERSARAAKAIAQATQELISALAASGGTLLILVVILVVMGFAGIMFASDDDDPQILPISDEVKAYEPIIQKYAKQYGIEEYVLLIEAVMMLESGGRTTDPMQCSECNFNTRYPHTPGSITDPEYSIEVGIQNLADCLQIAGCESPVDMEHIKLALQGYNYGQGYITWAMNKYGGYTKANAVEFSLKTAEQLGWSRYGNMNYVPLVLQYYPLGQIFYNPDSSPLIVEVAKSQIGNIGGEPYWRWYGFTERVGWCACFVSWCANECGYIDADVFPRFSGPEWGVYWFKQHGQWLGREATPLPGMIIFYDWNDPENGGQDGVTDHVGIVSHVENGTIYTIEGNSIGDSCRECTRTVGNYQIMGYGVPSY